jgi:hypothetical protein
MLVDNTQEFSYSIRLTASTLQPQELFYDFTLKNECGLTSTSLTYEDFEHDQIVTFDPKSQEKGTMKVNFINELEACAIEEFTLEEKSSDDATIDDKTGVVSYPLDGEETYSFKITALAKGGATVTTELITLNIGCGNEKVDASVE